jgi:hypothetical protein
LSSPRYRRATELLEAEVGDELVALEPAVGICFGFNEVATWVWRRLAEGATFEELRDGLLAEFDVSDEQCSRELRELIQILLDKKLIVAEGS